MKHKNISRKIPNGNLCPLGRLFYLQLKKISKHRQRNLDDFLLKIFRSLTRYFQRLTQWAFVTLGGILTYTTSNLNNLRNFLESNTYIDCNKCNHKNRHPHHNLPQTCGGSKSVCPVWIWTTDHFQSHLRTSFRINEC